LAQKQLDKFDNWGMFKALPKYIGQCGCPHGGISLVNSSSESVEVSSLIMAESRLLQSVQNSLTRLLTVEEPGKLKTKNEELKGCRHSVSSLQ